MIEAAPLAFSATHQPGTKRLTAYALGVLGLVVVQRSTVRALLPKGETKLRGAVNRERWHLGERTSIGRNRTSHTFGRALQEFEGQDWVRRTEDIVIVRDRQALLGYARTQQPAVTPAHLNVKGALRAVRNDFQRIRATATRDQIEQHHAEIRALLHLLHTPA
jgi:hypothetical protein